MEDFVVINWPDCQFYMDKYGWKENSTLIEPNEDMGIFSSTYLVNKDWIDSFENYDKGHTWN